MVKVLFYLKWGIKRVFFKTQIPLTSSIILTDKCNLTCKHCIVSNLGYPDLRFEEVKHNIDLLYNTGARMLVITGGEPFLWNDQDYGLDDVIEYAKRRGFFRAVVCTNGTYPLVSKADYLWVSLDGSAEAHNELRKDKLYQTVVRHLSESAHKGIYINFTISKLNLTTLRDDVESILGMKNIRGILLHLMTPYVGLEQSLISLDENERERAISEIIRLKRRHPARITNSFVGLKALQKGNWERPVWGSVVANQGQLSPCCCRAGIYNKEVCQKCGCTPAVETWGLQSLKPTALLEYLRYL